MLVFYRIYMDFSFHNSEKTQEAFGYASDTFASKKWEMVLGVAGGIRKGSFKNKKHN